MFTKYSIVFILVVAVHVGCKGPDDERIDRANILFERAVQYTDRGRYEEAALAFQNLIEVDTDLGRIRRVLLHERYMGMIAENSGDFEHATMWYNRSIESSRRAGSHDGIVQGIIRLASLSRLTGDFRTEFEHYQNALTYTQFFNYPHGEAIVSMHLGTYETKRGRIDAATHYFTQAVHLASRLGNPDLLYEARIALAENLIQLGNFTGARQQLEEAASVAHSIKDPMLQIRYALTFGELLEQVGQYLHALDIYESAWDTHRDQPQNDHYFLRLIEALADSYLQLGRYRDALSFYNFLTDLTRTFTRNITHGYALLGQSDGFLKFGIVINNTDHLNRALQLAREAEAHFGHLHYFTGQAYAVFQQARAASILGRREEALNLYINALSYLRETISTEGSFHAQERFERRNNLLNPRTAISHFLVNELIAAGRYDEAFSYTERDRQYTLNETVLRIGLNSSDPGMEILADSLTRLYRKMQGLDFARLQTFEYDWQLSGQRDVLRSMITSTRAAIETLQNKLSDAVPNSRRLFDKDVPSRSVLQQSLPAGRTLVSYYPTHTHLHTFVLNRGSLRVRSLEVPYEVLKARVDLFQSIISATHLFASEERTVPRSVDGEYDERARWVYNTFIEPILGLTNGSQHIIFVLPPTMHDLPLHVLREPRGRNEYLINRYRISYLPSATVLTFRLQPPRRAESIAAFGNPGGTDWSTDYEIRDIRGIYQNTRVHLEASASIENLKSERGDLLHIATEFFYHPRYPEHSYFSLTRGGSITVTEHNLTHLVGLHPFPYVILYNTGKALEGLNVIHAYLFFLNSSRAIILNQWVREPRSAKWFNENLYLHLSLEFPFMSAFYEAQKTLIATPEFAHPHFWGSFFLHSP